jgi:alpha-galactosidase
MNFLKSTFILLFTAVALTLNAQEIKLDDGWKFKTGDNLSWANPGFDDSNWSNIEINRYWEDQGYKDYDGYAWYRLKVVIPSSLKKNAYLKDSIKLLLGSIDDCDQTFLNGTLIGQNGGVKSIKFEDGNAYNVFRRYAISVSSPSIRWDKENVIAVRVHDHYGNGGIYKGPFSLSMVDVIDFLRFDLERSSFEFSNTQSLTKTVYLTNTNNSLSFSGKLVVNIFDTKKNKSISTKAIDAQIKPNSSFSYSFTVPSIEGYEVRYSYSEGNSGNKLFAFQEVPYILTPKPGNAPRINGAKVFGVRPGNAFLYTIAATGEKPLVYLAKDLPTGLKLDEKTGIISGSITKGGEYKVLVSVENKFGKISRDFTIVVGDKISLTPPMGWNSWNCWGLSVSSDKVKQSADAFANSGLREHGWTYVNIDDGWELTHEPANMTRKMICNEKFPDMKALADYVHSKGLKIGIYSSPGPKTCGGYEGSFTYEAEDAKAFADWNIDYLKYDWCSYSAVVPNPDLNGLKKPYEVMREALNKVNRDIVFSLCQYGMGDVWKWGGEVGGNLWRTTGDIEDTWSSVSGIGFKQDACSPYAKPGNWNDPDMLVVGKVGWGPSLHPSKLTANEQYTHISLWCLLSAPLLIGCDLTQLDDFTRNLLTNDEVIDLDQDPLAKQAVPVVKEKDYQIWVKELEDGSKAVGLFNLSAKPAKITFNFKDASLGNKQSLRDLWRQKDLGVFDQKYETVVPSHGVVLIKLSKQ